VRARLQVEVDVAAPAGAVWDYVTDWPRQGEWVPRTWVENVEIADGLGARFRAWSGIGRPPSAGAAVLSRPRSWRLGFWDPMTVTAWQRTPDGGGRCEVLHLGAVVKGEGEFTVLARGDDASRFVWAEAVVVPGGAAGALAWRVARPAAAAVIARGLRAMRDIVEREWHRPGPDGEGAGVSGP
jgi:Polyketide cyclase / dehydrase and lipid transport